MEGPFVLEIKNKRKWKLFDTQREGKGVSKKDADRPPNLKTFFQKYKEHFGRLLSVNIFMVLGNFPLVFFIIAQAGYFNATQPTPSSSFFPILHGVMLHESGNSAVAALYGVFGGMSEISKMTGWTLTFYLLSLLVLFTFGLVNVGTTYIIRNMIKGDPVFMWSDFWYAVKRNKKQGFFYGIFDLAFSAVLVYDVIFFYNRVSLGGGFIYDLMLYMSLACLIIYFFMRFYIYVQMITFDLSIFKILKNSLIFVFLGFKRNILALLGIVALVFINYMIYVYIPPLGIALPFVVLFSNASYMAIYASYYKIKEIMIDPYYKEEQTPGAAEEPQQLQSHSDTEQSDEK